MSLLKIRVYPDPILMKKAETVIDFGPVQQAFFEDMIETMYVEDGVGLAAPQVGISQRIMVASPRGKRGEEHVLVNPEIYETYGREIQSEGCLSFPALAVDVLRAIRIRIRYQDRHGKSVDIELRSFFARVIQHELDHLNGVLMIDHMNFMDRQKLLAQYQLS